MQGRFSIKETLGNKENIESFWVLTKIPQEFWWVLITTNMAENHYRTVSLRVEKILEKSNTLE